MSQVIELAKHAAAAAGEKKAMRIVCLDLRGFSDICDLQLVCSGENERQTVAIASAIEERLLRHGVRPAAVEGKQTGNWVLLDYGSLVVHIFLNVYRDYYALETLWPKARIIAIEPGGNPAP